MMTELVFNFVFLLNILKICYEFYLNQLQKLYCKEQEMVLNYEMIGSWKDFNILINNF